jgi:hypothetical protein
MNDWVEQEAWRQAHQEEIEKALQPMWVLWLVCLAEPVVLAVVVYGFGDQLREAFETGDSVPRASLRAAFVLISVVTLVVSGLLRHYYLRVPSRASAASAVGTPVDSTQLPYGIVYRTKATTTMTMTMSPSLFGFILFIQGDSPTVFVAFAGATVLGLLWHRPQKDELVAFCMQRDNAESTGRE